MKKTISSYIKEFLRYQDFVYGGTIEDHLRETTGAKGGTTSRELRHLENEGVLTKQIVKFDGKNVVQYRLTHRATEQVPLFNEYQTQEAPQPQVPMGRGLEFAK